MNGFICIREIKFFVCSAHITLASKKQTMTSQPLIRKGVVEDAECLSALGTQVWLGTYATDGINREISNHLLTEFNPENFKLSLANRNSPIFIAEVNHHVIGYAFLKLDEPWQTNNKWDVELATLYVHENFVRSEVGSALLDQCQKYVREQKVNAKIWLTVNAANSRAINFYREHRFEQSSVTYFILGNAKHENFVFLETKV
ncbi:MAG: N-acetyltransferase [Burkholderiales bacterium]